MKKTKIDRHWAPPGHVAMHSEVLGTCQGCAFTGGHVCANKPGISCTFDRPDGQNVIFKALEDVQFVYAAEFCPIIYESEYRCLGALSRPRARHQSAGPASPALL
jgi:hypothetical protein